MKNSVLFKSLIDIFFLLHVIGFIAILFKIPVGFIDVKNIEPPLLGDWTILAINILVYFIFLRGLFFLRKMARIFLSQNHLSGSAVNYMKTCGNQFIYAGLISILTVLTDKLLNLNIEPVFKSLSITPIFLMIVGLFFVIQSKTFSQAIRIKNENDLMV